MKSQEGIHFYINIANFNDIILDEEAKTKKVTHAIHALDTFFFYRILCKASLRDDAYC